MCECPVCGEHAYGPIRDHEYRNLQMPLLYAHRHHGRVYLHRIEWLSEQNGETVIQQ